MTGANTGTFSNSVSLCKVVGGKAVEVTMGKDGAVDFVVVILSSYAVGFTEADKITGSLTAYTATLFSAAAAVNNTLVMPGPANTPAANTAVALSKSMFNVMDTGSVLFTFTLGVLTSWNSTGRATVDVPKSYRPDLGENVRC